MTRALGWTASFGIAAALLRVAGAEAEWGALLLGLVAALSGVVAARWRGACAGVAAVLLAAACASLAGRLVGDDFSYHYVWLYSAPQLPWHLKLANLWGGEEGTLLLLALFMALMAVRLTRHDGWAGPGALSLTAVFALGALLWSPFAATPPEDLARLPSQGMNAHLMRVWMAFHPPLVLAAYAFVLAPSGAALEALAKGTGDWAKLHGRYGRGAWLVLSAGLAAGMWWAYEDFTFGQFWHWDPVQTSVFVAWALLSASLHGLRLHRPSGFLARVLPLLGLLASLAVVVSMMVTRNAVLATSHRYVGDTSWPLLLGLAAGLGAATAVAALASLRRPVRRPPRLAGLTTIRLAVAVFVAMGAVAALHLAQAYLNAWLGLPRPDSLKPFFDTLARWAGAGELSALRGAFEQWDVDNFSVNRVLAPLGVVVGLLAGHAFLRTRKPLTGWLATAAAGGAALAVAWLAQPLDRLYTGTGMTSRQTVEIFFWLDAMLVAAGYAVLACAFWSVRVLRRTRSPATRARLLPLGLIHAGVMLALVGAVCASVLDSYARRTLNYPQDFGVPQRFPDGYSLVVDVARDGYQADGGRGEGFRAVAEVTLELRRAGGSESVRGSTLYRDDRAPAAGDRGSVRQLCEILDYRFARYSSGPSYMLDPFIHRGLWRDVQVWVPAVEYATSNGAPVPQATPVTVVVKAYPLISWLWSGLAVALVAALALAVTAWRQEGRQGRHARATASG